MMPCPWDFSGQGVLISGGARGIGRALVRMFLDAGANVVFGDADEWSGQELTLSVVPESQRERVDFVRVDFSSENAWSRLLQVADSRGWITKVLVPNAGIGMWASIEELTVADYERVQQVNQRSSWLAMKYGAPLLRANGGGCIVMISSVMASFGTPNYIAYTATKSALSGIVKAGSIELAPDNIRVNSVIPGFTLIDPPYPLRDRLPKRLWTSFMDAFGHHLEERYRALQPLPVGGVPGDVANLVAFLCSPFARFITGAEIRCDGGLLNRDVISYSERDSAHIWTREMQEWLGSRQ